MAPSLPLLGINPGTSFTLFTSSISVSEQSLYLPQERVKLLLIQVTPLDIVPFPSRDQHKNEHYNENDRMSSEVDVVLRMLRMSITTCAGYLL